MPTRSKKTRAKTTRAKQLVPKKLAVVEKDNTPERTNRECMVGNPLRFRAKGY